MPVSNLKTYTDIIPAGQRTFHDFTVDVTEEFRANPDNWVPYVDRVEFLPLWFGNRAQPGFANILRIQPGTSLPAHYHPAAVYGFTIKGWWRYLEHDWVARPGTFLWEPPGEAHTLHVPADNPEPMQCYFVSLGGLIYVDDIKSGKPVTYDDGLTLLELSLNYYKEKGWDPKKLYDLCR